MNPLSPGELSSALKDDDRWLRDLARRLVRDTDLAEDAAQQTWVSVIASPPRDGATLSRGFLFTALKNAIAKLRRGDARRTARERAAATADPNPAGCLPDVVVRMELRRSVIDAVLALPEPYRETVLLRFHGDVAVSEIARRHGVPIATVKTRLRRAQQSLANALDDRSSGGRSAFLPALVALADRSQAASLLFVGTVMAVKQKFLLSLIAVLLFGAGAWLFESARSDDSSARERDASPSPVVVTSGPRLEPESPEVTAMAAERIEAEKPATPAEDAAAKTAEAIETRMVSGLVFDAAGKPAPNVALGFDPSQGRGDPRWKERTTSDASGAFAFELSPAAQGSIAPTDRGLVALLEGVVNPRRQDIPPVVVVAQALELSGRVVDRDARPIAGASVQVAIDDEFKKSLAVPTENASSNWFSTESAADGSFALPKVPRVAGSRLVAEAIGFVALGRDAPDRSDSDLQIVLERPSPTDPGRLRGQVQDEFGAPQAGAAVCLGYETAITDERGLFDLSLRQAQDAKVLRAAAAGHLPAEIETPLEGFPEFVVLKLGPSPLAITGVVLHADGEPAEDVLVHVTDGTVLGIVDSQARFLEEYQGGGERGVRTDSHGRFTLNGLLARPYALRVFDAKTLLAFRPPAIAAGSRDVVIELPREPFWKEVRGTVVDHSGRPIEGAKVGTSATRWIISIGGGTTSHGATGTSTETDAEGRFTLENVGKTEVSLEVSGETVMETKVALTEDAGAREVRIEVDRRCHFSVELPENEPADHIGALDAAGENVTLTIAEATSVMISGSIALRAGRSGIVVAPDRAVALVLLREGKELRRIPLTLVPGEVVTIRE